MEGARRAWDHLSQRARLALVSALLVLAATSVVYAADKTVVLVGSDQSGVPVCYHDNGDGTYSQCVVIATNTPTLTPTVSPTSTVTSTVTVTPTVTPTGTVTPTPTVTPTATPANVAAAIGGSGRYTTVIPSAAYTTEQVVTGVAVPAGARGCRITLDVTVAGAAGGLTLRVSDYNTALSKTGKNTLNTAPTIVTTTGTYQYDIYPAPSTGNNLPQITSAAVGNGLSFDVQVGTADAYTYSLVVEWLY